MKIIQNSILVEKEFLEERIIKIISNKNMTPKNLKDLFHSSLHTEIKNSISKLCDKGILGLDTNMILFLMENKNDK